MTSRSENLLSIRPTILSAKIYDDIRPEELFQNKTLRPIIKMQHDLIIAVFRNYITKRKNVFYNLDLPKQLSYINDSIQKDIKFKNSIEGIIIGQFTVDEYALYIQNSSALNKRITNIVKERLVSSIQILVQPQVNAL